MGDDFDVVVCFFVIVEDLFEVSFVGQQEIFFNVCGIEEVLNYVKLVFVLLYNDCVIFYCVYYNFEYLEVVFLVGVQCMVCIDFGVLGVVFIFDIEFGFWDVVFVIFFYGLGEMVVQGVVNFDEFFVYKFVLEQGKKVVLCCICGSKQKKMIYVEVGGVKIVDVDEVEQCVFFFFDDDFIEFVCQCVIIEKYYGCLMDIEWGKDGCDVQIYIL